MVVIIAGGDEAGRGPLIGPLTLSLVAVKSTSNFRLSRAGVRDSKLLSRKRREKLYSDIMDIALEVKIDKIEPKEINDAMENNISLNELEAVHFAKLFDSFDANVFISKVYLDSPDVVQNKFGIRFSASSSKNTKVIGIDNKFKKGIKYTKVIAEHKADVKYPTVSAASIIAKVTRDKCMDELSERLGIKLGSGYPSDHTTIDAVRNNITNKELLKNVRIHWKTMKDIKQTELRNFNL